MHPGGTVLYRRERTGDVVEVLRTGAALQGRPARPAAAAQRHGRRRAAGNRIGEDPSSRLPRRPGIDRKSTRLNSSHVAISYAVFCLKKKKTKMTSQSDHV